MLSKQFQSLWPMDPDGMFVHVTGPRGVGKTIFTLTTGAQPDRMAVFDGEASAALANRQIKCKVYHNLIPEFADKFGPEGRDIQFYQYVDDLIEGLPDDAFDVLVFDNILRFEAGLVQYVEANITKFGISQSQLRGMPGMKWGPIKSLYQNTIVGWHRKAGMVLVTTPIGQDWVGGRPSGTWSPKGKDVLEWLTSLRVWLKFAPGRNEPAGLVLKDRVCQYEIDPIKGVVPILVLPQRIEPCTWGRIRQYMEEPADRNNPTKEETLSNDEWAIMKGILPEDKILQLRVIELQLEEEARERDNLLVKNGRRKPDNEMFGGDPDALFSAADGLGVNRDKVIEIAGTEDISEVEWGTLWEGVLLELTKNS
ncbi:hypothetical protein KKH23_07970 [Patescibacteria group bacterium]|nr:hypothetical protein [Patescibacteria group bacterium]